MSERMSTIPQRDLRNDVSRVLRRVEQGESFRITVRGRPVADLVPVDAPGPRRFVPAETILPRLRAHADPSWRRELEADAHLWGYLDEL